VIFIMSINKKTFGVLLSGEEVYLYTLKAGELSLSLSTLGASVVSLIVPSRRKKFCDVCLGYPTLDGYARDAAFLGATVGRFANRIAGGSFTLDGRAYRLSRNEGVNTLHGGSRGFNRQVWKAEAGETAGGAFVRFELDSPDGDEGFPGRLRAAVIYSLSADGAFTAEYAADADAPCPVNITNHAYFNLAGEGTGDVLAHEARIFASTYAEVDEQLIPTGHLLPVADGPFDFRERKPFERDIAAAGGGYDHCFVIDGVPGTMRPCAEVFAESSRLTMRVSTTYPGCQLYTGHKIGRVDGKVGSVYGKYSGLCLETQYLPDSPNRPEFPSAVFGPERPYREKAAFAFSW
jgi:aldose 1-epimerase